MKKLINWLIKKLGGYTRAEFCEQLLKRGEAVGTAYDLLNKCFEKDDKYTAEHEAYLALLNCHNATAEAAQNGNAGVAGAIDTIKAYCKSKDRCENCALYNKNSGCKILEIPCYWGNE